MHGGILQATVEQRAQRAARFSAEASEAASRFAPPLKTEAHPAKFVAFSEDKREALIRAARARLAAGEKLDAAQRATLRSLGVGDDDALLATSKRSAVAAAAAKRGKRGEAPPQAAAPPALSSAEQRLLASLASLL